MGKVAVLLNPSAGKGRALREKEKIEYFFQKAGIDYDLFISTSEEHLRRLAGVAAGSRAAIIGVGGDTTFKIIAAEILKKRSREKTQPAPVLGMIGAGSANDIARALQVRDVAALCEAVRDGAIREMDTGCLRIAGREEPLWFLGSLSAGLGAAVNRYIEAFCRRHPRLGKFPLFGQALPGTAAVRHAFINRLVPLEAVLEYDGTKKEIVFSLLVFANIPYYANGMRFHPRISPFDGQLDAVVIHTGSLRHTLKFALRAGRQKHFQDKEFEIISSPSFRLTFPDPVDVQLDGDIVGGLESFEVSLLPGALRVFSVNQ
ncbi:MAG: hypothetical protein KAW12_22420 [Candidatus Aminicenantes bacterium]|nr:hypothetical protein [Candidatus Aminicenantes bacterium]